MTTNLETGGTLTNVFTANSRDHSIVDNGDGTITITTFASGGSRFYDAAGKSCSATPARLGSPSTSTTTAFPVIPATTSKCLTPSGLSAPPPVTATFRARLLADLAEFTN